MANRTFKQFGVGYDPMGSVSIALTIGGSEVFNGAVSVGTTNVFGTDMTAVELFSFELDESVTGDITYQIAMTGSDHTSKLWLANRTCNLIKPNMTIQYEWFSERLNALDMDNILTEKMTAEDQAYMATTIGETRLDAQKAGTFAALNAGTALIGPYGWYINKANEDMGGKQTDVYMECDHTMSNGVRDGESYDVTNVGSWPLIKSGSTLNMTVGLGLPSYAYAPDPELAEGGSLHGG